MCESYSIRTYLEISGASSCRCIGIASCVRYNRWELYPGIREVFGLSAHNHVHMLDISFAVCQAERHVVSRGWPAGRPFTQHLKGAGVAARKQTTWRMGHTCDLRLIIPLIFNIAYIQK